jgi:hypothetical protein
LLRAAILVLMLHAVFVLPADAQTLRRLVLSHPNSYDYSGSVLYDADPRESRWKAWWCGRDHDHDGIYYAWSVDKIHWSTPQLVFRAGIELGELGLWDSLHVCHPNVLKHPLGAWSGWEYVMYYTGSRSDTTNKVGIALSMDGVRWHRWHNPATGSALLLDCPTGVYGCGIPSIVTLGTEFMGTFTVRIPGYEHVVRARSSDGIHWTDIAVWDPIPSVPGAPGISTMYSPDDVYKWLSVFTYNDYDVLYGSVYWGAPWVLLSSIQHASPWPPFPWGTTSLVSFYRSMEGHRPPDGSVWSMFGTPALDFLRTRRDIDSQELQAIDWGDGW